MLSSHTPEILNPKVLSRLVITRMDQEKHPSMASQPSLQVLPLAPPSLRVEGLELRFRVHGVGCRVMNLELRVGIRGHLKAGGVGNLPLQRYLPPQPSGAL